MLSRSRAASQTRPATQRVHHAFHAVCAILRHNPPTKILTRPTRILAAQEMGMRLLGFRETTRFTRRVVEYLGDESYAQLQWYLLRRPEIGDLIQAGGGVRKVRWAAVGKGKRGGT